MVNRFIVEKTNVLKWIRVNVGHPKLLGKYVFNEKKKDKCRGKMLNKFALSWRTLRINCFCSFFFALTSK